MDDTKILGILDTTGYLSCPPHNPKTIARAVLRKLDVGFNLSVKSIDPEVITNIEQRKFFVRVLRELDFLPDNYERVISKNAPKAISSNEFDNTMNSITQYWKKKILLVSENT